MDATIAISIIIPSVLLLFGIVGYFLKIVHNDVRKNTEENGKLKGKIELLETKNEGKFELLQQQTNSEIKAVQKEIGTMAKHVGSLSSNVEKILLHFVENYKEEDGKKK